MKMLSLDAQSYFAMYRLRDDNTEGSCNDCTNVNIVSTPFKLLYNNIESLPLMYCVIILSAEEPL